MLISKRASLAENVAACLGVDVRPPDDEALRPGAIVLVDLERGQADAALLSSLRCRPDGHELQLVAIVEDESAARDAIGAGADELIWYERLQSELAMRLASRRRASSMRAELLRREDDLQRLVELTRAYAGSLAPTELLPKVTETLTRSLGLLRASVVLAEGEEGRVLASSDGAAGGPRLDLRKYPEIREVLRTGKPLLVEEAVSHPLLDPVRESVAAAGAGAMAVLPLQIEAEVLGVLFLRAGARRTFAPRELDFAAAVANATAVALRNARAIDSIHEERRRAEALSRELEEAERRAMLAELAGAAAHELNQPLTSILGYAELLSRRLDEAGGEGRQVRIVLREAERMAEIVRKIGRITRRETKEYVAGARILDLERASDE